jgi:hypothetical protein
MDNNPLGKLTFTGRNRHQPMIEGGRLIWRNFAGAAKTFTPEGKRTANVVLTEEMFHELGERGFNVKRKEPRNEGDDPLFVLEVEISYREGNRPPKIIMITSRGRTELDADTVGAIDFSIIRNADIIINPYNWTMNKGKPNETSGVKAYLEAAYITIEENALDEKYADLDDSGDYVDEDNNSRTVRFE